MLCGVDVLQHVPRRLCQGVHVVQLDRRVRPLFGAGALNGQMRPSVCHPFYRRCRGRCCSQMLQCQLLLVQLWHLGLKLFVAFLRLISPPNGTGFLDDDRFVPELHLCTVWVLRVGKVRLLQHFTMVGVDLHFARAGQTVQSMVSAGQHRLEGPEGCAGSARRTVCGARCMNMHVAPTLSS